MGSLPIERFQLNDMFLQFFCLCPLGLTIKKLNFDISKVAYSVTHFSLQLFLTQTCSRKFRLVALAIILIEESASILPLRNISNHELPS